MDSCHNYVGTVWYRRTVDVDAADLRGRDALLRFGAVDYETTVWVNGVEVGYNRDGYLPFEFDASEAIEPGENTVVVRVTDPENLEEIPHGKQGDPWYTRVSGIWQSVALAFVPPTRTESVRVTPDLDRDEASVEVTTRLGPAAEADLTCVVRATPRESRSDAGRNDGDGSADRTAVTAETTVSAAETTDVVLPFDDPAYWRPESPALYDVTVELVDDGDVVDRYADYFGMRSFGYADGQFLLNGEEIELRGVLDQGYYPETQYRPPTDDAFAREVTAAKGLGFNLIRKHVKPAHPEFLREADKQGILVWEEPANPTRYTARSQSETTAQLAGLVERDYNRPSVVVWSLYNEEWGVGHHDDDETLWTDAEKQQFLADAYRSVRERDATRLVCDNSGWAHVTTDVNDFHRYFASPDRAETWEDELDHMRYYAADNYATTRFVDGDVCDVPVVASELGTWGMGDLSRLRDRYGGDPEWFSHEFLTEPLKRPEGVDERFETTELSEVFDDFADLEAAWQRREFVSIKHLVEQIRVRDGVAGYVLTQLSDIEWEFNGLFDYLREEKSFCDEFARVNAPLSVVAEPDVHAVSAGDSLSFDLTVVNSTREPVTGTLGWSFLGESGRETVTVGPNATHRVGRRVPEVSGTNRTVGTDDLSAVFEHSGDDATTTEPVTVVDCGRDMSSTGVVYAGGAFASRLASEGVDVTHELTDGTDLAFVTRIDAAVERYAAEGGTVVHLPTSDGTMTGGGPFVYRSLPKEASWLGATSFFYQNSPLLAGVCDGPRLGWEFEGLYPYAVATDLDSATDDVHVGCVEGWLANPGSPLVVRSRDGGGPFVALTFRVQNAYGSHPIATLLCDRLIEEFTAQTRPRG
ncbi:beta-galactosidase [Candidatus Halobonum tyrrellensis G22]|uniref:Beta-galactosidase n=2 Tax=Candidatus Halobonum TaxID=1431544 RepID=V4HPA6_9EURY|nr:beta-galactosidase [Candidatus Halobonum tyrrellensis G22]